MAELTAVEEGAAEKNETIPISIRGQWVDRPCLSVNGQTLVTQGKWIKIAAPHDEDWTEKTVADPEACICALRERSSAARADIFCFSQKLPDVIPHYGYPMEMRSIAAARIGSAEEWRKQLPESTRRNIKLAAKRGVVVKVRSFDADVVRGICDVQNESPIRQGRRYPHYGKTFEQARRDHGSFADRSDFICAWFEDEFIGFLKLVYLGEVAAIMQILSKAAHYEKRTSDALLAKAVELCAERGAGYLRYELFNYGNKGDSSLREFKVRRGFSEMLLPYYYAPVTPWGRFCVKTKLYRSWHNYLPHGLIKTATGLRAKWYGRKGRLG